MSIRNGLLEKPATPLTIGALQVPPTTPDGPKALKHVLFRSCDTPCAARAILSSI